MNEKLVSFIGVLILILTSACGAESDFATPTMPDIQTPTSTLQETNLNFWKATADFGTFTFVFNLQTRMGVVGKFDFPEVFSCGSSEVSGISYEVFDINVTFPLLAHISKRDPSATVTFPVDDVGFTVGPFWVSRIIPATGERMPVLTMALIGKFDSDTRMSGEYTAYFVKSIENTELQNISCTGTFTATLISP
jgi:hypothetical protein